MNLLLEGLSEPSVSISILWLIMVSGLVFVGCNKIIRIGIVIVGQLFDEILAW